MGMDEIAKSFHVDVRTVMSVRDQNPEAIDAPRVRRISKLLGHPRQVTRKSARVNFAYSA